MLFIRKFNCLHVTFPFLFVFKNAAIILNLCYKVLFNLLDLFKLDVSTVWQPNGNAVGAVRSSTIRLVVAGMSASSGEIRRCQHPHQCFGSRRLQVQSNSIPMFHVQRTCLSFVRSVDLIFRLGDTHGSVRNPRTDHSATIPINLNQARVVLTKDARG